MKKISLNKSDTLDVTFQYEPGTIRFGFFFGREPYDCGWIGISLPFIDIALGWQSPKYDHEWFQKI
jgi:hypothetical protein